MATKFYEEIMKLTEILFPFVDYVVKSQGECPGSTGIRLS